MIKSNYCLCALFDKDLNCIVPQTISLSPVTDVVVDDLFKNLCAQIKTVADAESFFRRFQLFYLQDFPIDIIGCDATDLTPEVAKRVNAYLQGAKGENHG